MNNYNNNNFFINTFADFTTMKKSKIKAETNREPDYISYVKRYFDDPVKRKVHVIETDIISSMYWYTQKGVIRYSDHWGKVASCVWLYKTETVEFDQPKYGFCQWKNFHPVFHKVQNLSEDGLINNVLPDKFKNKDLLVFEFNDLDYLEYECNKLFWHNNHIPFKLTIIDVDKDKDQFDYILKNVLQEYYSWELLKQDL